MEDLIGRGIRRLDGLLTRERLRAYPVILIALWTLGVVASWFLVADRPPLPDFLARWTAGRSVVLGQVATLYDPAWQSQLQAQEVGASRLSWFVSPPYVAPMLAPLGALPYLAASAVWVGLTVAALGASLQLLRRLLPPLGGGRWPKFVLVALGSYPVLELLASGQDSAIVLLSLVCGMHLLKADRQTAAGAVLALGLIKPQLTFLVPVVLLLRRRYTALMSFVVLAATMIIGSGLLMGLETWKAWLALPSSPLYAEAVQQGQAWKTSSLPGWLLSAAPPFVGDELHVIAYAAGLLLVVPALPFLLRRATEPLTAWGLALATSVVTSPHWMVYDLVVALPVITVLIHHSWTAGTRVGLAALFLLLWLSLPLHVVAERLEWPLSMLGSPWHSLVFLGLWIGLLRTLRRGRGRYYATDFG